METNKVKSDEILKIISERKERSNKDLELAMKFIQTDFEYTKDNLIKLSEHLDKLETTYNVLLKEHKTRKGER
jgi:hypothetical protein